MAETGMERRRGPHDVKSLSALLNSQGMLEQIRRSVRTGIEPSTLARIALTAVQRNPELLECTERSLLGALLECVQVGLEPNVNGQAYLVPYRDHGIRIATLIIGYRGFVQLAYRSKMVAAPFAANVYSNERHRVTLGSTPTIEHEPLPPSKRGEWLATYATAKIVGSGDVASVWMWREEVEAIQKRSRASEKGPWVTDTEEMQKKTAFRRLAKWLPLSPEFARAVEVDEEAETGRGQSFIDIGPTDVPPATKTERLKDALPTKSAAEIEQEEGPLTPIPELIRQANAEAAAKKGAPQPEPPPAAAEPETVREPMNDELYSRVNKAYMALQEPAKAALREKYKMKMIVDVKRWYADDARDLLHEIQQHTEGAASENTDAKLPHGRA